MHAGELQDRLKKALRQSWTAGIAAALLLASVPLIRWKEGLPLLTGRWPYYHEYVALHFMGFFEQGQVSAYHFLVYIGSYVLPVRYVEALLPWMFGVAAILLFGALLRRHTGAEERITILLVTAASPLFLYAFIYATPFSVSVFLLLLFVYSLDRASHWSYLLALLIGLAGVVDSAIALLVVYLFYRTDRKGYRTGARIITALLVLANATYALLFWRLNIGSQLMVVPGLNQMLIGIGVIVVPLAVIGMMERARRKETAMIVATLAAAAIGIALLQTLLLYAVFAVMYYAGIGADRLIRRHWSFAEVRTITLIAFGCGILFSGLVFLTAAVHAGPTTAMADGLSWLRAQPDGTVLSAPMYGFWIQDIAGKEPFCSDLSCDSALFANMTETRDLSKAKALLSQAGIRYLLITPEMEKGLVWAEKGQGLEFLLTNNDTFTEIYAGRNMEIYRVDATDASVP